MRGARRVRCEYILEFHTERTEAQVSCDGVADVIPATVMLVGKIEGVQNGRDPESISICLRVRRLILLRFCKFVKGMIENP